MAFSVPDPISYGDDDTPAKLSLFESRRSVPYDGPSAIAGSDSVEDTARHGFAWARASSNTLTREGRNSAALEPSLRIAAMASIRAFGSLRPTVRVCFFLC